MISKQFLLQRHMVKLYFDCTYWQKLKREAVETGVISVLMLYQKCMGKLELRTNNGTVRFPFSPQQQICLFIHTIN